MLSKKQEKEIYIKIMGAVGKILNSVGRDWTDREVAEITQVPTNRLTEYKNFEKYQRPISLNHLVKLIGGSFMTIEGIIKETPSLTDKEKKHLQDMDFYESAELRKLIVAGKKRGADPLALYKLIENLHEKGVDPIAVLEKANGNT